MRALVAASLVVMAFAVVLLAGPLREHAGAGVPGSAAHREPTASGTTPEHSPRQRAQLQAAVGHEAARGSAGSRATGAPVFTPASAIRAATTPHVEAGAPAAPTGRLPAAPGVRHFMPGSREHARAIASTIESQDYVRTVEPLARLYLAYFGRVPDYEGLRWYMDEHGGGTPLPEIAEEFAGSPEFGMRYGELDNAAFVDRIYRNVREDGADAQRAHWIAQLDSGALTRGELVLAFSEDPRFRAATGHAVFVTMAYAEVLQRAPSAAELARWLAFLEAGRPHGAMLDALVGSRAGK